jgi:hypothetical protein
MMAGVLAGFGVALLLDARFRKRREARVAGARAAAGGSIGGAAEQVASDPVLAPRTGDDLSDDELVARVAAMVDIPLGVEVTAVEGAVVLFGRIPRYAFATLLSRVARVPGVVDVEDRLTPVDDLGPHVRD